MKAIEESSDELFLGWSSDSSELLCNVWHRYSREGEVSRVRGGSVTARRAAAANSSRWDYTINGAQLFTRAARAYFHPRTIPLMWQPHFPGCLLLLANRLGD